MVANNLRFVILGEDRGSRAFDSFSRSVNRSNRAVDQNRTALQRLSGQSDSTGKGMLKLTGTITGFSDATSAASRHNGYFAKGMAALSLTTGLLEPEMAGLVVTVGALSSAFASAAIGGAAYGLALKSAVTPVTAAMQAQAAWMASKTPAAAKKYHQALKQLNPVQIQLMHALAATKREYQSWGQSLSAITLRPLAGGLKLIRPLLRALTPAVQGTAGALLVLQQDLSRDIKGGGFARWIASMRPVIFQAIVDGGHTVINVIKGLGGVLKAFAPEAATMTGGIEKLSERFARWGQTLSSHGGFRALMETFRKDTPVVNQVLKNLAVILKNVVSAMAGFSSPSNSLGLLSTLQALSGIIARLSANKQLMNLVLTFLLWSSIARKVLGPLSGIGQAVTGIGKTYGTIKTGVTLLGRFRDGFANANAAASEFSGTAGTMGGKVRTAFSAIGRGARAMWGLAAAAAAATGAWIRNSAAIVWNKTVELAQAAASKVAAAAQWLWNAALSANPIGLVIIAVGALVAAVILAYKHFRWFRDFVKAVWRDVRAWTVGTWHVVLGVIRAVWGWIKGHWPLLLGILTGPIGAAVVLIIRYRNGIWNGIKAVWNWIRNTWHRILGWLTAPFRAASKIIGGIFRTISGWIHSITGFLSGGGSAPGGSSGGTGGVGGRYTGGGGTPQAIASRMLPAYGWGAEQFGPLNALWTRESGWRVDALNSSSGAYGIPQSLPASKMASAGADWRTNPATQIRWGLSYIKGRYGSPGGAWSHEQSFNWYGKGMRPTVFSRPTTIGVGERGPEVVSVTPLHGGGSRRTDDLLLALISAVERNTDAVYTGSDNTARGVAAALGVAGSRAAMRNRYSPA